jgi:2-keto-4-pentenoate hydratase/2-oxohepta-3-ene-1,7-dioic acid hydratase in catechol pathway
MRVVRVRHEGRTFYASLGEGVVISLNRDRGGEPIPLPEVSLQPLVLPSKIVCVSLNHRDGAMETGLPAPRMPSFVLRPGSSLLANGRSIRLPAGARSYPAASLGMVIGQSCRNIRPDEAGRHIFGYTCVNDIRVHDDVRDPGHGAERFFDGTCPIGPWLETSLPAMESPTLRSLINGEIDQQGDLNDMLFSPGEILSCLSRFMTLNPGDLVLAGSPSGGSAARAGDKLQVEISGLGSLFNSVEDEEDAPLPLQ